MSRKGFFVRLKRSRRNVALLKPEVSQRAIHIVLGSITDSAVGRLVYDQLRANSYNVAPIHILSCHRNPLDVYRFAEEFAGSVIIAIGGKSFQLPAVLDSLFRDLGKHVVIFGIPVGKNDRELEIAISAMRDVPSPCLIHWQKNSDPEIVKDVVRVAVGYVNKALPLENESEVLWNQRLSIHRMQYSRVNIRVEELRG